MSVDVHGSLDSFMTKCIGFSLFVSILLKIVVAYLEQ
ncbi:Uncharacterised protein [Streptococcus pyogenes]|nr:hypothetical protein Z492_00410 [Streptococcus pyogenes ABC020052558]EZK62763.1 hypothetical protein Z486_00679 [Streptococcus pyogenes ABC020048541]EZK65046.1 hypothetical protein Z484_00699 [Streptococcus pyogenes ABC020047959]EZK69834.1 hypothetical protein Z477_01380 [Streptococcus pyogenes ABC020044412]EZK70487.1 hypothetical protein Z482_00409 [Streptococcus pyogenes ABC020047395]EZK71590.1 hypothetical protein Z475_00994 [Streptococcus pyogenes ABC020044010]EZK78747.1 hypothetical p